MSQPFRRATAFVHALLRDFVREGDLVVDATCGRGHDTLFLAHLVGRTGEVIALDIQAEAIEATRRRLEGGAVEKMGRVTLSQEDHVGLGASLASLPRAPIAVVFNLGYLPGGDKTCITTPATTIPALDQAVAFLEPDGLLCVTVYAGHPGGRDEADAVDQWMSARPQERFEVIRYGFVNQLGDPPYVYGVRRLN